MIRELKGKLEDLAPEVLLQLIASSGASGILRLSSGDIEVRVCFVPDGICAGGDREMKQLARMLDAVSGEYVFQRGTIPPGTQGVVIDSGEFLAALQELRLKKKAPFASEIDVEALVSGQVMDVVGGARRPEIHVLDDTALPENPLDDLLADLEQTAPDELMMVSLGIVTVDPRPWRRGLQREWTRRAWKLEFFGDPLDIPGKDFDLVIIHHQLSMTRVGSHDDWIRLVERLRAAEIPVVWVGPLGDSMWVARLVEAEISFLLPPPQGEGGESWRRFGETLGRVVERQLFPGGHGSGVGEAPGTVVDLVDGLLHGANPEEALASFLQLAAVKLQRGAVLTVEPTLLRCRAGFGYPLLEGGKSLPRGLGLLERVIRTAEPSNGIEGKSSAAQRLALALGLDSLPDETVLIPLRRRDGVAGLFVGDRMGAALPDLKDIKLLATRLGGLFV